MLQARATQPPPHRIRPSHLLVIAGHFDQNSAMQDPPSLNASAQNDSRVDLMFAIANGRDRSAFKQLFEEFAPRVKSFAMRMGAEPRQAEDLAQDVMLTVWRRAAQFNPAKAGVSTWIFAIARNRRIDLLRREKRPEFDATDPAWTGESEPTPDDALQMTREHNRVHAALAELPKDQAEMLRLAFIEDMTHSAIAAELEMPLGTVKSRIRLAMGKMRLKLGGER